jgi:hypothetical protein
MWRKIFLLGPEKRKKCREPFPKSFRVYTRLHARKKKKMPLQADHFEKMLLPRNSASSRGYPRECASVRHLSKSRLFPPSLAHARGKTSETAHRYKPIILKRCPFSSEIPLVAASGRENARVFGIFRKVGMHRNHFRQLLHFSPVYPPPKKEKEKEKKKKRKEKKNPVHTIFVLGIHISTIFKQQFCNLSIFIHAR